MSKDNEQLIYAPDFEDNPEKISRRELIIGGLVLGSALIGGFASLGSTASIVKRKGTEAYEQWVGLSDLTDGQRKEVELKAKAHEENIKIFLSEVFNKKSGAILLDHHVNMYELSEAKKAYNKSTDPDKEQRSYVVRSDGVIGPKDWDKPSSVPRLSVGFESYYNPKMEPAKTSIKIKFNELVTIPKITNIPKRPQGIESLSAEKLLEMAQMIFSLPPNMVLNFSPNKFEGFYKDPQTGRRIVLAGLENESLSLSIFNH